MLGVLHGLTRGGRRSSVGGVKVATGKNSPGTVVEKGAAGTMCLKETPTVDIARWMSALDLAGCQAVHEPHSSPRGGPAVLFSLLKNPQNPPNQNRYHCILAVWGEAHSDGISLYFVARPYESGAPTLTMKFKEWRPERGMAAILAVMAFHAEAPRLPRKDGLANEWLRRMRDKIQKSFFQETGAFLERGIHPDLVLTEGLCHRRFDSLAGLDVQESLRRVRKEFGLLINHMTEEDVLKAWREAVVENVLKS